MAPKVPFLGLETEDVAFDQLYDADGFRIGRYGGVDIDPVFVVDPTMRQPERGSAGIRNDWVLR